MTDDLTRVARRRTSRLVAAVAAVPLVAAATVAAAVIAAGHRSSPAAPHTTTVESDAPGWSSTAPGGASPPVTAAAMGAVTWTTVLGAKLPVSATAGPRDTTAGRARGFAHTPAGAVLAAAHISVRLSPQAGPAVFEPTLSDQVIGPDADALGQHLAEDYQTARAQLGLPYGAAAGQLYSTMRGYQVSMDGADAATVGLLIEGPGKDSGSVLVAAVTHMQWTRGDWMLVAPPAGDWSATTSLVTDITGYTRFPDGG